MSNKGTTNVKLGVDDKKLKKGFKSAERQVKGFGGTVKKLAGITAGLFAFRAIFQGIKKFIKLNADFGQSLANLSAITGAVGADLKYYEQQAKLLGKTTTISAADTVKAFELMGSARPELLKNKEALAAVTKEAIILAEASGLDLPTATLALAKAMNQFNAPASDAAKIINILAAGSKEGAEAIPGLADAIKWMGTSASMANISLETSVGMIETLAEKGLSGAESGTQLRNVILKLQSGVREFNPAAVGMITALENLGKANLTTADLTNMFGLRNQQAAAILIENIEKLKNYTAAVTGTNVAYEQQAKTVDTIQGKWKLFTSAIQGIFIANSKLRESIKRTLTTLTEKAPEIINGIIDIINKIIDWRNTNEKNRLAHKLMFAYIKLGLVKLQLQWQALVEVIGFAIKAIVSATTLQFEDIGNMWEAMNESMAENTMLTKAKIVKIYKDLAEGVGKEWKKLEHVTEGGGKISGGGEGGGVKAPESRGLAIPTPLAGTGIDIGLIGTQLASVESVYQSHAWTLMKINKEIEDDKKAGLQDYLSAVSNLAGSVGDIWATQKEKELSMVGDNAKKRAEIEKKYAKKEQKIALAQAAINTAVAITKALPNIFLASLAGVAGAIQIAAIAAQKFALGGAVTGPTMAMVGEAPGISRSNPEYIGTAKQLGLGGGHLTVDEIILDGMQLRILLKEVDRQFANSY